MGARLPPPIRILVADDHSVLCESVSRLLESEPDMAVVAMASDGKDTVKQAVEHGPDVALVDLTMPHSGLAAIVHITDRCPKTRTVALTMHDSADHRRAVLEAGGSGYLPKSSTSAELLAAIRAVHAGRSYFGQSPPEDIQDVRPADLSSREVRVLRLVALGYTNREISEKLGVHKKTVDTFRCRLQKKLEVRSRAEVVRYALRNGLLDKMR